MFRQHHKSMNISYLHDNSEILLSALQNILEFVFFFILTLHMEVPPCSTLH